MKHHRCALERAWFALVAALVLSPSASSQVSPAAAAEGAEEAEYLSLDIVELRCPAVDGDRLSWRFPGLPDCEVSAFRKLGERDGRTLYFARYLPNAVLWSDFPVDVSRDGLVVMFEGDAGGKVRAIWRKGRLEAGENFVLDPELVSSGEAAFVTVLDCLDCTGGCSQEALRWEPSALVHLEPDFLDPLRAAVAPEFHMHKGWRVDIAAGQAEVFLKRDRDPNCCGSAKALARVSVSGTRLVLDSVSLIVEESDEGSTDLVSPNGFESDLWPGEGVPQFATAESEIRLHRAPGKTSPSAIHRWKIDWKIPWDETVLRTTRAGYVLALRDARLEGRALGPIQRLTRDAYYHGGSMAWEIALVAGQGFKYVQYRAEGACFIAWGQDIVEVEWCPWAVGKQPDDFKVVLEPETEWWIRVIGRDKRPMGWLLLDDDAPVRFLDRLF